jgi:hypothetical protein
MFKITTHPDPSGKGWYCKIVDSATGETVRLTPVFDLEQGAVAEADHWCWDEAHKLKSKETRK